MAGTTNLYLIRHGEADANVNQVVGGTRGDTGLTARGAREAELLRDRLAASGEIAPDVFVASTFARARQTAEILAPAFSAPLSFDDDLQEIRPGEADGMSVHEAMSKYGVPDFEREPQRPVSPGGESWADLMNRAARTLKRLIAAHEGKTTVLVTHGGFIDGAFLFFLRLRKDAFPPVQFASRHTSLTHWQKHVRWNQTVGFRLVTFNDTMHLRGASS
jgi:probable phosphoglycerate mutase